MKLCGMWGSKSSGYEVFYLLGHNTCTSPTVNNVSVEDITSIFRRKEWAKCGTSTKQVTSPTLLPRYAHRHYRECRNKDMFPWAFHHCGIQDKTERAVHSSAVNQQLRSHYRLLGSQLRCGWNGEQWIAVLCMYETVEATHWWAYWPWIENNAGIAEAVPKHHRPLENMTCRKCGQEKMFWVCSYTSDRHQDGTSHDDSHLVVCLGFIQGCTDTRRGTLLLSHWTSYGLTETWSTVKPGTACLKIITLRHSANMLAEYHKLQHHKTHNTIIFGVLPSVLWPLMSNKDMLIPNSGFTHASWWTGFVS
jgi:hypothetical protein